MECCENSHSMLAQSGFRWKMTYAYPVVSAGHNL
jgi:hypothetical protein